MTKITQNPRHQFLIRLISRLKIKIYLSVNFSQHPIISYSPILTNPFFIDLGRRTLMWTISIVIGFVLLITGYFL
jgi:hypothetical protein